MLGSQKLEINTNFHIDYEIIHDPFVHNITASNFKRIKISTRRASNYADFAAAATTLKSRVLLD